ncbi:rCG63625, partial [Rattus norvegicus]
MCVLGLGGTQSSPCMLVGHGSVFESSQGSRLSVGLPVELLSCSGPSVLPPALLLESLMFTQCLAVVFCISFSQLLHRISQRTVMVGSLRATGRADLDSPEVLVVSS